MINRNFRNFIFDLDGTLVDSMDGIGRTFEHTFRILNYPVEKMIHVREFIGPPLAESFRRVLKTDSHTLLDQAIKIYRKRYIEKGIYESSVFEGVHYVLGQLHSAGCRLFIVTNKPTRIAVQLLRYHQLLHFFEDILGADSRSHSQDKMIRLKKIIIDNTICSLQSVYFGDRDEDMIAAVSANIFACGALYGYGSRSELEKAGSLHLITSPFQILNLI